MTTVDLQLQRVLDQLESLHERCLQGVVRHGEASASLKHAADTVFSLLPVDSDVARLFDKRVRQAPAWWTVAPDVPDYVLPKNCVNIKAYVDALREVMDATSPQLIQGVHDQVYLQEGQVFRARQEVFRLMRRANQRIDIADGYLDPGVFDYVDSLDSSIEWRLLLKPRAAKGLFVSQLGLLRGAGLRVTCRTDEGFHDRFLILDGIEAWHLGASLNGAGKKAFMINRVVDPAERARVLADFETWWTRGGVV